MFKIRLGVVTAISIIVFGHCTSAIKQCHQVNSCQCEIDELHEIDISSVIGTKEHLEDKIGNITYYFLGCKDNEFPKENSTIKASFVIYNATTNATQPYRVYNASNIKFQVSEGHKYEFLYNKAGENKPKISLVCHSYEKPFLKIIDPEQNTLVLSSPKVCVITKPRGLSDGSVFLIILALTASVYFFGGALILYFIRGARGFEIIPNIDFWKSLPGLVKDGVVFILGGCRTTYVSTARSYDQI